MKKNFKKLKNVIFANRNTLTKTFEFETTAILLENTEAPPIKNVI